MTSKIPDQVIKAMQEAYRFEHVGSDVDWRAAANVIAEWAFTTAIEAVQTHENKLIENRDTAEEEGGPFMGRCYEYGAQTCGILINNLRRIKEQL